MANSPVTRQKDLTEKLQKKLSLDNAHAVPRIQKVVINVGLGRILSSVAKPDEAIKRFSEEIARITGQRPIVTRAKKSIASFKTRVGQPLGLKVTLRGARMEDFLNKLIHVALPRSRDFKGLSLQGIDKDGNLTLGIREHNIFLEVADAPQMIGFEVTVVTNTHDKEASLTLLRDLGIPFVKEEA